MVQLLGNSLPRSISDHMQLAHLLGRFPFLFFLPLYVLSNAATRNHFHT